MIRDRFLYLQIFIIFAFLTTGPLASENDIAIGRIDKTSGEVTIMRAGHEKINGEEGLSLFPGDYILTGEGAMVWFSLKNTGHFRLGEEAEVAIDELSVSDPNERQSVLRLVLGYVRTKIGEVKGGTVAFELHTPVCIVGIRGTEFDTVVSVDSTSVFTVDDGVVELEVDGAKIVLEEGKMTQVDVDGKPGVPGNAIPMEERDWQAWREDRNRMLLINMPKIASKFRNRFEKAFIRSEGYTDRVKVKNNDIIMAIQAIREARRIGDREGAERALGRLKEEVRTYRIMVETFRKALNRVQMMGRLSYRMENFASKNQRHFSEQDLAFINLDLEAISKKRDQLRIMYLKTVMDIRQTFKALKVLKRQIEGLRRKQG